MKIYCAIILLLTMSCEHAPADSESEPPAEVQTPVTITHVTRDTLREYIELNARSSFLLKSYVKANANGYLVNQAVRIGQFVNSAQPLFTIKTKEAESIGNAVNMLDSSFKFSGVSTIRSGGRGYITQLDHVSGDYVQDGEQLAVVSEQSSFAFLMDVPYELRSYISVKEHLEVILPDGTSLQGYIASFMPNVDPAAQTQSLMVKLYASQPIPENLVAKVRIVKREKADCITVPAAAVLTGETQSEFWIMQVVNDTTAVKVPVQTGMSTKERTEIVSPVLNDSDRIVLAGNYGLEDTAKIKITR